MHRALMMGKPYLKKAFIRPLSYVYLNPIKSTYFYQIENKTFFRRIFRGVQKRIQPIFEEDKDKTKSTDPKGKFSDLGKMLILEADHYKKYISVVWSYCFLYPLSAYTGYKVITKLITFKLFSTIGYGVLLGILLRVNSQFEANKRSVIVKIYLLEDGKRCEIVTMADKFIIDISNIRLLKKEETLMYGIHLDKVSHSFYPLLMNEELVLISKRSTIYDQDFLNKISKGEYIDERDLSGKKKKSEYIDV